MSKAHNNTSHTMYEGDQTEDTQSHDQKGQGNRDTWITTPYINRGELHDSPQVHN